MIDFDANYRRLEEKKTIHANVRLPGLTRTERTGILPSPAPEDEIVKLEWLGSSEKLKFQKMSFFFHLKMKKMFIRVGFMWDGY